MEAYLMEVTQTVLLDCFSRFVVNDFESGQNKLRRLIKATSLYAQRSCKSYIYYFANYMRALGFYMAKNWVEAIKCINPLISECPRQGKYFVAGLSDLLIMLSECYSSLTSFQPALLSAKLAVSTIHERLELLNQLQQTKVELHPLTEASKSTSTVNWDQGNPTLGLGIGVGSGGGGGFLHHGSMHSDAQMNRPLHHSSDQSVLFELSHLSIWIKNDILPCLNISCGLASSYFNLACQLEKNDLGHLSLEWYNRAIVYARRCGISDEITKDMKESMEISKVHVPLKVDIPLVIHTFSDTTYAGINSSSVSGPSSPKSNANSSIDRSDNVSNLTSPINHNHNQHYIQFHQQQQQQQHMHQQQYSRNNMYSNDSSNYNNSNNISNDTRLNSLTNPYNSENKYASGHPYYDPNFPMYADSSAPGNGISASPTISSNSPTSPSANRGNSKNINFNHNSYHGSNNNGIYNSKNTSASGAQFVTRDFKLEGDIGQIGNVPQRNQERSSLHPLPPTHKPSINTSISSVGPSSRVLTHASSSSEHHPPSSSTTLKPGQSQSHSQSQSQSKTRHHTDVSSIKNSQLTSIASIIIQTRMRMHLARKRVKSIRKFRKYEIAVIAAVTIQKYARRFIVKRYRIHRIRKNALSNSNHKYSQKHDHRNYDSKPSTMGVISAKKTSAKSGFTVEKKDFSRGEEKSEKKGSDVLLPLRKTISNIQSGGNRIAEAVMKPPPERETDVLFGCYKVDAKTAEERKGIKSNYINNNSKNPRAKISYLTNSDSVLYACPYTPSNPLLANLSTKINLNKKNTRTVGRGGEENEVIDEEAVTLLSLGNINSKIYAKGQRVMAKCLVDVLFDSSKCVYIPGNIQSRRKEVSILNQPIFYYDILFDHGLVGRDLPPNYIKEFNVRPVTSGSRDSAKTIMSSVWGTAAKERLLGSSNALKRCSATDLRKNMCEDMHISSSIAIDGFHSRLLHMHSNYMNMKIVGAIKMQCLVRGFISRRYMLNRGLKCRYVRPKTRNSKILFSASEIMKLSGSQNNDSGSSFRNNGGYISNNNNSSSSRHSSAKYYQNPNLNPNSNQSAVFRSTISDADSMYNTEAVSAISSSIPYVRTKQVELMERERSKQFMMRNSIDSLKEQLQAQQNAIENLNIEEVNYCKALENRFKNRLKKGDNKRLFAAPDIAYTSTTISSMSNTRMSNFASEDNYRGTMNKVSLLDILQSLSPLLRYSFVISSNSFFEAKINGDSIAQNAHKFVPRSDPSSKSSNSINDAASMEIFTWPLLERKKPLTDSSNMNNLSITATNSGVGDTEVVCNDVQLNIKLRARQSKDVAGAAARSTSINQAIVVKGEDLIRHATTDSWMPINLSNNAKLYGRGSILSVGEIFVIFIDIFDTIIGWSVQNVLISAACLEYFGMLLLSSPACNDQLNNSNSSGNCRSHSRSNNNNNNNHHQRQQEEEGKEAYSDEDSMQLQMLEFLRVGNDLFTSFSNDVEDKQLELQRLLCKWEFDFRRREVPISRGGAAGTVHSKTDNSSTPFEEDMTDRLLGIARVINDDLNQATLSASSHSDRDISKLALLDSSLKSDILSVLHSLLEYLHLSEDEECLNNMRCVSAALDVIYSNAVDYITAFDWSKWFRLRDMLVGCFGHDNISDLMAISEEFMYKIDDEDEEEDGYGYGHGNNDSRDNASTKYDLYNRRNLNKVVWQGAKVGSLREVVRGLIRHHNNTSGVDMGVSYDIVKKFMQSSNQRKGDFSIQLVAKTPKL